MGIGNANGWRRARYRGAHVGAPLPRRQRPEQTPKLICVNLWFLPFTLRASVPLW